jgi:hypothetical protein
MAMTYIYFFYNFPFHQTDAKMNFTCVAGGKGGSFLSGIGGGLGGGSSDSYASYDNSHGHDSYSSAGGSGGGGSSHHGGYSRSFLDEAEIKVNTMIEAASKFFEGEEEPAKTQ